MTEYNLVAGFIRGVRNRILDPAHFCQRELGLDKHGNPVYGARMEGAVRWCVVGSMCTEQLKFDDIGVHGVYSMASRIIDRVSHEIHGVNKIEVNNRLGHDAIIDVLNKAIKEAEAIDG